MEFEVYMDEAGAFRFRMRAKNGETLGDNYTTKKACLDTVKSIKKNAAKAKVVDLTK